jgi:hypothetical protein
MENAQGFRHRSEAEKRTVMNFENVLVIFYLNQMTGKKIIFFNKLEISKTCEESLLEV